MTMMIVVENKDHFRTAEVVEEEIGKVTPSRSYKHNIVPLGSQSFYIHASKRLIISEDPNATVSKE
jgi:hypothetical protein